MYDPRVSERLHLDLHNGARAEMIAGALVAVGAPAAAAQEALARVGLGRVDVVTDHVARAGLAAMRCRLLVDGADLGGPAGGADPLLARTRGGPRRRHATARPRLEGAPRQENQAAATPLAAVQGEHGLAGGVRDRSRARGKDEGAGASKARVPRGAPGEPARWLDGTDARAADLVDVIRAAPLPTVVKALALKSARRLVDALAAVTSSSAPRLRGARAARILADLVVGAALVDALSPASVTASPLGVSTTTSDDEGFAGAPPGAWPTPSPWLLEVLAGVPVVEGDHPAAIADVAGAALAWSIVHRFGARGVTSSSKQGLGASALDDAGRALVARALLGPAPPVATRAGSKEVAAAVVVEARLSPLGLASLDEVRRALLLAGAGDIEICQVDVLAPAGAGAAAGRGLRLRVLLPAAAVDSATAVLWRAGAVDVEVTWVERRRAGLAEVTVPVGRGRSKSSVRVRVVSDGAETLRVDPDADDVREAAARARASVHTVAAEAIAAWERLRSVRGER